MKKVSKVRILMLVAALGGTMMLLMRLLHLNTMDAHGLLESGHITGICASVLALLLPAFLLWQSLVMPKENNCSFPASIPATAGYGIGAIGIAITAVQIWPTQSDPFQLILSCVGIATAIATLWLAYNRWQGVKSNVLLHTLVSLFFILLLLWQYRQSVTMTQLQLVAYAPVATVCLMISVYHRACFEWKMGQLRLFVFFRLAAILFSLAAIPGTELWVLYLAGAIWSAADLANLTIVPQEGGQ